MSDLADTKKDGTGIGSNSSAAKDHNNVTRETGAQQDSDPNHKPVATSTSSVDDSLFIGFGSNINSGSTRSFLQEPRRESMFTSDFLSGIVGPQGNNGGGLSAASSRRPSYAAEFSSRPRFLDLADAFASNTSQAEMPRLSAAVSNPNLNPFNNDLDKWLKVGSDGVIGPGGQANQGHAPAIASGLRRGSTASLTTGVPGNTGAPLWNSSGLTASQAHGLQASPTREEFTLPPVPPSQKKSFRSLSFSTDQRLLHHQQQPGSHQLLGSFNEEDDYDSTLNPNSLGQEDLSLIYGAIGQESSSHYQTPPSLWFNSGIPGTGAKEGSRRHSYAGENFNADQHQQQQQHQNQQQQQQQQTTKPQSHLRQVHQSQQFQGEVNNPTSPVASTGEQVQNLRIHDQAVNSPPKLTYTEAIENYFSFDKLGRNTLSESILGQQQIQQRSPRSHSPSSISGSPTLSSAIPANLSSLISVPSKKLYFVQFKAGRLDVFFIPDSSGLVVHVNDLVIVDADRGRDLGKVVKDHVTTEEAGMLKYIRHQEQQAILQHNPNSMPVNSGSSGPGTTMPKQILRFAQSNEVQQITSKQSDEEKAVSMCVHKVQEKGLDMSVIDAEYQWDRRKLTFFYSATHRIDFRDLVRELFRIYKTRIWMCAVNPAAAAAAAAAATDGDTKGNQLSPMMDRPTPSTSSGANVAKSAGNAPLGSGTSKGSPPSSVVQSHVPTQSEYGLASSQLLGPGSSQSSEIRQQPPLTIQPSGLSANPEIYDQVPSFDQWEGNNGVNNRGHQHNRKLYNGQMNGPIPNSYMPLMQPIVTTSGQFTQPIPHPPRAKYPQYGGNIQPISLPPNAIGLNGQYWYGPPPPPPPTNTFY
ncbi:Psp1p [Sugiyamaella lignohabitans]|uniref:Psp1p n=1 Tax=Sugiyamaella lignohabitans TaxID=796027 RepID=A0A161HNC8_9ASCO|nr:Psp1p [Sugiyamaella lignohabitans]ANB15627.1 Psp1p [Sugiyamaella lignohabitans]